MKVWGLVALGTMLAATTVWASPDTIVVKDPAGAALVAAIDCSDCQAAGESAGKACHSGVENGWIDGKPCGKCLLSANPNARLHYAYDLQFTGKLTDENGQPAAKRFVKMYLANGWTVRTRTGDDGTFRLMLGAIDQRAAKNPVVTDLGTRVDAGGSGAPDYALFLLPSSYNPCSAQSPAPTAKARASKKKATAKKKK